MNKKIIGLIVAVASLPWLNSCMADKAEADSRFPDQFIISGTVLDKDSAESLPDMEVKLTTYSSDGSVRREENSCSSGAEGEYVLVSEKWTRGDFYRITVRDPAGNYVYAGDTGLTIERNDPSINILRNQTIFMVKSGQ